MCQYWYLVRVIKARLTELSVIFPVTVAEFVLQLHLSVGGKLVWALRHTHLGGKQTQTVHVITTVIDTYGSQLLNCHVTADVTTMS